MHGVAPTSWNPQITPPTDLRYNPLVESEAMKAGLVTVLALVLSRQLAAQWLKQPTTGIPRTSEGKPNLTAPPPRTPEGKPDFSGLWTKLSPKYARNVTADLKADDVQPWVNELVERRREDLGR